MTTELIQEFDLNNIWQLYAAARENPDLKACASRLGLPADDLQGLMEAHEPLQKAYDAGKTAYSLGILDEWVDEDAKKLWEEMKEIETADKRQQALAAIADGGESLRQRALVVAMHETYFDLNRCCQLLGISKRMFDRWMTQQQFREVIESVHWAKKNFVESSLLRLVALGSEKAIIAANQGLNRETYGKSLEITGKIQHIHGLIDLNEIHLPFDVRCKIIDAIKQSGKTDVDALLIEPVDEVPH